MSNDTIIPRLEALELAESARAALNDYCLALDTHDLDLLGQVFSKEAVLQLSADDTVTGNDQIVALLKQAIQQPVKHRKHFVTNVTMRETTPERATGECYFFSMLSDPGEPVLAWGRFQFTASRSGLAAVLDRLEFQIEQAPVPASVIEAR